MNLLRILVLRGPRQANVKSKVKGWVAKKVKILFDKRPPLPDSSLYPPTNCKLMLSYSSVKMMKNCLVESLVD